MQSPLYSFDPSFVDPSISSIASCSLTEMKHICAGGDLSLELDAMYAAYVNGDYASIGAGKTPAFDGTCSMVELDLLLSSTAPAPGFSLASSSMAKDMFLPSPPRSPSLPLPSSRSPPSLSLPSPSPLPPYSQASPTPEWSLEPENIPIQAPPICGMQDMTTFGQVQCPVASTFWEPPQNMTASMTGPFDNQAASSRVAPASFPVQDVDVYGRSIMVGQQSYWAPPAYRGSYPMGSQAYPMAPPYPSVGPNGQFYPMATPMGTYPYVGPNGQYYPMAPPVGYAPFAPATLWPGQQMGDSNFAPVSESIPWLTQQAGPAVAAQKQTSAPAQKFLFTEPTVPKEFVANPKNHGRWKVDKQGGRVYLNGSREKLKGLGL